jgi:hypothetical protein
MRLRRVVLSLLGASVLGFVIGCSAGSGEIPLAKVPPPPEGFGVNKNLSKLPSGASPVDANSRRR